MTTLRTARIASIIEKRRPLAKKIEGVEANLRSLASALRHLEEHRDRLMTKIDDPNVAGRLKELNFSTTQLAISSELDALAKLKARFSRDTLNIGVVGRARQGKSRLLQSITGLTAAEIPDGDRQHCTGVRSTIHHNPNIETCGEVSFHSERSFLDEVIAPYYEQLRLGAKPFALQDFASQPLPPLPSNLVGAEVGAKYEHLRHYHANLDKYRPLLRQSSPRRISRNEIREYVAQDTPDGQRVFFNYLAVREVKIVCTFPNSDVGQIALVDMPGLGDTGIGDENRLIQTLGQDVDFVLFVRMPKPAGDYWADVDVRLYDTASAALVDLPLKWWSFMILNKTEAGSNNGNNSNNCQDLADTMAGKHIEVIQCVTANCANSEEVNSNILDPALEHLAQYIERLDGHYASACQERLRQLQSAMKAELEKAREALGQAAKSTSEFPLFERLFEQLWNDLTGGLEGLLRRLGKQRDEQDLDFKKHVDAAIAACRTDTGVPTIDQIESRRDRVGGYPNAYYEYLNEIRAHLSQHFLSLDDGLKEAIQRVKSEVAQVLIDRGRLGNLTLGQGVEFLKGITEIVPEEEKKLKLGFQILLEFDLAYRGMIQHRIRQHLDGLTPDKTDLHLSPSPSVREVFNCLKASQSEAVYNCQNALEDLLAEPSQAAFAIVEEFVDRVLRAEGVKTEWRIFLQEVRSEVWPTEFEQLGERTRQRREWLDSIERAMAASQPDSLIFLQ